MVNRVATRPYYHRYGEEALDLCDVLGSYIPGLLKLDDIRRYSGLPEAGCGSTADIADGRG
jgi:hypothetical protein